MKTIISKYSLARNEVGNPIGNPVVENFPDGKSALLALEKAMNNPADSGLVGFSYLIELNDGRQVPFDTAYTEIFGELPIKRDNRENLYPCLHGRKSRR